MFPEVDNQKIHPKVKSERVTSRELQTIVRILNVCLWLYCQKKPFNVRISRRKPFLSRKKMLAQLRFAMLNIKKLNSCGTNALWTDETKVEVFGYNEWYYICRKTKNTLCPLSSMVVEDWWLGHVLLPQVQDPLNLLSRSWTHYTSPF